MTWTVFFNCKLLMSFQVRVHLTAGRVSHSLLWLHVHYHFDTRPMVGNDYNELNLTSAPNALKNVLWYLKWHRRKFLAKTHSGFWEKSLFVSSSSTIREDRESHFATHHTLLAKRTWSRLTLLLCSVRKGPPRPNFTCLHGNKVFLHSRTDKALLGSHSKDATQNPIECAKSLIWQACLKETPAGFVEKKLWRLQQLEVNEKKSVRRLYDMVYLPLTRPDFQLPPDHGSPWEDLGASVVFIMPNVRSQRLVLKRRLFEEENGKEGFGGCG